MSISRFSARRAVIFALLLLASLHIDATAARAWAQASTPVSTLASLDPAAAAPLAGAGGAASIAPLDAAGERNGALASKTCPRAGACAGYILPLAPPLAVPAPVRGQHRQVVWQEPTPVAIGRLTPPPR